MNNKPIRAVDAKPQIKSAPKEIITPSFAKVVKDDSPKASSNFKEIQRLRKENTRLSAELSSVKDALSRKEEFSAILNKFGDEKYDLRRMHLYKAKVAKQDRIIFLMQTALDAQRTLYFEMENIVGGISKLLKNTDRPEQVLSSISSIIKSALKVLRDAELSSQIAYSQLLSSRKISDTVEIDFSSFPDWKSTVKISGQEVLDLEICLSDLLSTMITPGTPNIEGKLRESCSKLLKIGVQLPLTTSGPNDEFFDNEAKKMILLSCKSTSKNEIKDILNRLSSERKSLKIEKEMIEKELESKIKDINQMQGAIRDLKKEIEDKGSSLRSSFEENLLKPFEDIWGVYKNIDQGSAVQLFVVFKMHAGKIRQFVDNFLGFRL